MPVHDELGIRMKSFYEEVPKTRLMRRTPVMIRIDGKCFHSFTKGFHKPFDEILIKTMQDTMKYLCEHIQGCVLGYTQSDEITLVLTDYKKLESQAWFNYEIQKCTSIAASMATMAFNKFFADNVEEQYQLEFKKRKLNQANSFENDEEYNNAVNEYEDHFEPYYEKMLGAMFDARIFNVPKEEVTNFVYWRQVDATRNSIQMVGRANFSHTELDHKTQNMIQDMLMIQKGINWNNFPTHQKRGSCCIKETYLENDIERSRWVIDKEIPIFKGEDREYIEKLINF